ncbi:Hypothetical Protein RRSL_04277 [Ralstonia solanacearum UW551]|uniref:Uncharacterized protein n=1 Tax=Ralstonia solanacearum (strain UW551) TaxID=342110 RepID=A0AB33VKB2_RALSU|nr:Hypothetical Protein RRSL_04277 [Ralstonia solanacearum UW551]
MRTRTAQRSRYFRDCFAARPVPHYLGRCIDRHSISRFGRRRRRARFASNKERELHDDSYFVGVGARPAQPGQHGC